VPAWIICSRWTHGREVGQRRRGRLRWHHRHLLLLRLLRLLPLLLELLNEWRLLLRLLLLLWLLL
jgi:hypothetical protein